MHVMREKGRSYRQEGENSSRRWQVQAGSRVQVGRDGQRQYICERKEKAVVGSRQ